MVGWIGVIACVGGASAALDQSRTTGDGFEIPTNATALEGVPAVRIDTTQEGATRRELGAAEAAKNRLRITVVNGQYYWASRKDLPLTVSSSGEFIYLSSREPGKYVRVRRLNDKLSYIEHVDMALGSVTYWGELRIVVEK
jgi:hypothetical protein